jgi:hypothetical protein
MEPFAPKVDVIALRKPAAKNPGRIVDSVTELVRSLHEEAKVI